MMKILIVGQIPLPYHGQAIMIKKMLEGKYKGVELIHAGMKFSRDINEVGRFQFHKLFHLIGLIWKIIVMRFRHRIKILYYPPAGPNLIPVLRDIILLICIRPFFQKTIFHFRASGASTFYPLLPSILKPFYRRAYFSPDIAIRLSRYNPEDGRFFKAKAEFIVPEGIADDARGFQAGHENNIPCRLLYIGRLIESKGVKILIESAAELKARKIRFHLTLAGQLESSGFGREIIDLLERHELEGSISLPGLVTGEAKLKLFHESDIFCFPTFFESESFGIVLLEAMQFSLPVVSTQWRGVQSVVRDGETGFLVPIQNSQAVTEKLQVLIQNPELRRRMGRSGREEYLKSFSLGQFYQNMQQVFASLDLNKSCESKESDTEDREKSR